MDSPVKLDMMRGIVRVTLNRPAVFNAFDLDMMQVLFDKFITLAADRQVAGVILTGKGTAFCAGADLKWVAGFGKSYGETLRELATGYHQVILEIRRMPKPVVAAINGIAAGGGFSFALACDFRVMEASAVLRHAYTTNGLSIDGGGTFNLPRMVGLARAMEIATFDPSITAQQAHSWGLVTEVAEDGQAVKKAAELLEKVRRIPLSSFAACKKLLTDSLSASFETQLEREREALARCGDHPNGIEGIEAFLEKRKPVYT